ncbi:hypothetical protein [Beijerinckia indica]|uniref:Uncharacterized protein n=1 Tax=Beijerinckia indica subsp. indica (strain ATCC 9039 / DSM 1715 / NCIMB 8712) TaxID=395963 RepID=B2IG67_BEII9|nr:hypothetical protein [Beijerinckia indica]ACB97141.1 conserved hypothetical protein [Beijerinckia indica subsp. indica ATCC 9039]
MLRLFLCCIWICIVTSVAFYVGSTWSLSRALHPQTQEMSGHIESKTTANINVPMIQSGELVGYIVTNFIYNIDQSDMKKLNISPEVFILDEAFHILFSQDIDFNHLEKYQISALKERIKERVNQRLGGDFIKDILIKEFNYIPKREIPQ